MTALIVPGSRDLQVPEVTYARVDWGRWIADCPHPFCRSALALTRDQPSFQCWDCGTGADIVWPPNPDDIARILLMRPDPAKRNWRPGEDLHDLLRENLEHGLEPIPVEAVPRGGVVLTITGDRITYDPLALSAPHELPELEG